MTKYGYLVGGILFLSLVRNCIAAPDTVGNLEFWSVSTGTEIMLALAVSEPSETPVDPSRKECLAVSIYEESSDTQQLTGLPVAQVTFSYTFSKEYPLMVCGLLPQNTA